MCRAPNTKTNMKLAKNKYALIAVIILKISNSLELKFFLCIEFPTTLCLFKNIKLKIIVYLCKSNISVSFVFYQIYIVNAIIALAVCNLFSASSKTIEISGLSITSSVTS